MTTTMPAPTLVVGASRGLGRAIAEALARDGGPVVAVARDQSALADLAASTAGVVYKAVDATASEVATELLHAHNPRALVIVAGAWPTMAPLHEQTWDEFSTNWSTDVQVTFRFVQSALLQPMPRGSKVIVISSGAALAGSPLSGGYAGAKATQRFIAAYAQDEADRAGLGLRFSTVFPRPVPATDIGRAAVHAYAARDGKSPEEYLRGLGGILSPEDVGQAVVELRRTDSRALATGYLLSAQGLQPVN
jgi:NAD(P)-dependent dehydrogenase (short-subunit alcohol dehydrogenase family)